MTRRPDRKTVLWGLLLAVVLFTRLYDLGGGRAMSHDESMYATYSWYLADRGEYRHDPMLHGPLLFHLNALVFLALGDSDFTARLAPALLGTGLVLMLLLFRRGLGERGAFCAALLVAASPSLLFYSRYVAHDIHIAFLLLVWVFGVFRYLETGRRAPLWLTVLAMALSFAVKANTYMHIVILASFLTLTALRRWRRLGQPLLESRAAELVLLMFFLTLPLASALGHPLLGTDPLANTEPRGQAIILAVAVVFGLASLILAGCWFGLRRLRGAGHGSVLTFRLFLLQFAVFWLIETALHTGMFTSVRQGFCSGVAGTLGYWIGQHGVGRGDQPAFFYVLLLLLYEFLPLLTAVAGGVALLRGKGTALRDPLATGRAVLAEGVPGEEGTALRDIPATAKDPSVADGSTRADRPDTGAAAENPPEADAALFLWFCLWWAVWSFVLYTIAGERMPWLTVHIALPLCLLGGAWLGAFSRRFDPRPWRQGRALLYCLVIPLLVYLLVQVPGGMPFQGRSMADVLTTMKWARVAAGAALLAAVLLSLRRGGRTPGPERRRLLAAGGLLLLALLTLRTAYLLAFVNQEYATELLVYAHGSPDISQTVDIVKQAWDGSTGPEARPVAAYGDEAAWPFTWHLRRLPVLFYGSQVSADLFRAPVVLAGPKEREKIRSAHLLPDRYAETRRTLIWWPLQGYHSLTWEGLWGLLTDPARLLDLWQYLAFRRTPGVDPQDWSLRSDFFLLRETSDAAAIPARVRTPGPPLDTEKALGPYREVNARMAVTGPFAGRALMSPFNLSVMPDGGLAVADSGNDRIVLLDASGGFRREITGSEPPAGAGAFEEPAGVVVSTAGEVFVADTWNGRIQVFDPEGQYLRSWGSFQTTDGKLGDPFVLYGPRGLSFDVQGNLIVADAGNCRILRYSPAGAFLQQTGGRGAEPGELHEPVDVKFVPGDNTLYVSDSWNERVQQFSDTFAPLARLPVPAWDESTRLYKPYIAPGPGGVLYASVPGRSCVLVLDSQGTPLFHFGGPGRELNRFAAVSGLAVDAGRNRLYAADPGNNRVLVFDLDGLTPAGP